MRRRIQTFPLHGYAQDFFRFSKEALTLLFEDAGLQVIDVAYEQRVALAMPTTLVPRLARRQWNRAYPSGLCVHMFASKRSRGAGPLASGRSTQVSVWSRPPENSNSRGHALEPFRSIAGANRACSVTAMAEYGIRCWRQPSGACPTPRSNAAGGVRACRKAPIGQLRTLDPRVLRGRYRTRVVRAGSCRRTARRGACERRLYRTSGRRPLSTPSPKPAPASRSGRRGSRAPASVLPEASSRSATASPFPPRRKMPDMQVAEKPCRSARSRCRSRSVRQPSAVWPRLHASRRSARRRIASAPDVVSPPDPTVARPPALSTAATAGHATNGASRSAMRRSARASTRSGRSRRSRGQAMARGAGRGSSWRALPGSSRPWPPPAYKLRDTRPGRGSGEADRTGGADRQRKDFRTGRRSEFRRPEF